LSESAQPVLSVYGWYPFNEAGEYYMFLTL